MPIYEYVCQACGAHKEVLQKITDDPITECIECGQHQMHKQISSTSFQLKGTGWYVTDFRNGSNAPSSPKEVESSAEQKEPTKPVEKTDAKPSQSETPSKAKSTDKE